MKQVFNKLFLFLGAVFSGLFFANITIAVCPVCIVAIGTCVGLSRWLGVDDTISGTWIGALIIALIIWTLNWLKQKNIKFPFKKILVAAAYYIFTVVPLYMAGIMGHPLNKILGIDKILFGIIMGTIVFLFAISVNNFFKKINNNKVYFPYQKVVIPLLFLIIISVILHFVIGCQIKIPFK